MEALKDLYLFFYFFPTNLSTAELDALREGCTPVNASTLPRIISTENDRKALLLQIKEIQHGLDIHLKTGPPSTPKMTTASGGAKRTNESHVTSSSSNCAEIFNVNDDDLITGEDHNEDLYNFQTFQSGAGERLDEGLYTSQKAAITSEGLGHDEGVVEETYETFDSVNTSVANFDGKGSTNDDGDDDDEYQCLYLHLDQEELENETTNLPGSPDRSDLKRLLQLKQEFEEKEKKSRQARRGISFEENALQDSELMKKSTLDIALDGIINNESDDNFVNNLTIHHAARENSYRKETEEENGNDDNNNLQPKNVRPNSMGSESKTKLSDKAKSSPPRRHSEAATTTIAKAKRSAPPPRPPAPKAYTKINVSFPHKPANNISPQSSLDQTKPDSTNIKKLQNLSKSAPNNINNLGSVSHNDDLYLKKVDFDFVPFEGKALSSMQVLRPRQKGKRPPKRPQGRKIKNPCEEEKIVDTRFTRNRGQLRTAVRKRNANGSSPITASKGTTKGEEITQ
eukprot:Awhi_evm1s3319